MSRNCFKFENGCKLTTIGATWFTSYYYYKNINSNHLNWKKSSTARNRISTFNNTTESHKIWLLEILKMKKSNLERNQIGLTETQIKKIVSVGRK